MKRQAVACILSALILCPVAAGEIEERAIAAIVKWGGKVTRPEKGPVVEVFLGHTRVTDIGLKELAHFKQLKSLELSGTKITDAGLKELRNLKYLEILKLDKTLVTDRGMKELAKLKQLQALVLSGTKVTDAGLTALVPLK